MDTIFATATARGRAGISVVRISGPQAFLAVEKYARPLPDMRKAALRKFCRDSEFIDECLVLCFNEGSSFTGEPVVEFQIHGSIAIERAVLLALQDLPGFRLAEPGEFSRRALMNDRMDLAQIEGLGDLIEAETEAQRKQALKLFSGALGERASKWRKELIRAAALLEATIDFADEDVPVDVSPEVMDLLARVSDDISDEIQGSGAAERIREGFEIAIVGPPNAGKSTLLNALAGRDAAITSEIAGTTRDVIEVRMDLGGFAVTLLDTAGLRESDDVVESIGVSRAIERAKSADLRWFLSENGNPGSFGIGKEHDLFVTSKADLKGTSGLSISAVTGFGIEELIAETLKRLEQMASGASTAANQRQRHALELANAALENARIEVSRGPDFAELAAEEIRTSVRTLEALVGHVDVEHVLDEVFSSFCLGK